MVDQGRLSSRFTWTQEPIHRLEAGRLRVTTAPDTDFWQRTHYGFQRDNGHVLGTPVTEDFSLAVRVETFPRQQYDQAGLMVRADPDHWIKASCEFETPTHSRLGSVVTNRGYSDWATVDLTDPPAVLWYRIRSQHQLRDFLIEASFDGLAWRQLRIARLQTEAPSLRVGLYACSPLPGAFDAVFDSFSLGPSDWV